MKIIAVGKNYADHALEFDGTVERAAVPMIFMKPDSSILKNGKPFSCPTFWDVWSMRQKLLYA
jgi:2-keto-4-pentenoate hydratase/2-oxohepta-3-ene-1,7-dioic acid hydratase in catechol pathway